MALALNDAKVVGENEQNATQGEKVDEKQQQH